MNQRYLRLTFMILILLFSLVVFSPASTPVDTQERDAKAYQKAYNLILQEKWEQAEKALSQFVRTYRRSAWVDDARFWMCYAKEKMDHPLEDVFSCYQNFIKAYSSSKWVDDAKANLVRITIKRKSNKKSGCQFRRPDNFFYAILLLLTKGLALQVLQAEGARQARSAWAGQAAGRHNLPALCRWQRNCMPPSICSPCG